MFFPWADEICAVSQGVAHDLAVTIGIPLEQISVLYNPVISDTIKDQSDSPSGHPWLDAKDRPVILGAGNLIEIKDHATLLRAFATLRSRVRARLIILGEGSQRSRLQHFASDLGVADDINLPGFVQNPLSFMARADVFALSSLVEGLPTVIIEALACGSRIVSTDCPYGPAELLLDGALGHLVPVGDDVALAEALEAALATPADAEASKARARLFSVDAAVADYLSLLRPPPARSAAS